MGQGERPAVLALVACGVLLIGACWLWLLLSRQPVDVDINGASPIVWLVAIGMAAGAVYLILPWAIGRLPEASILLAAVVAVGVVMRILMLPSTPMLENDFYRYLWDGAVTAEGLNPYAHAPATVQRGEAVPEALGALAEGSEGVLERVNHPEVRTIYPPVAQAIFAVAHWLAPWNLAGLRLVLLVFDSLALLLLIALLRQLGLSPLWSALYWWNPLIVKEFVNSAHMDAILIPLLLAVALLIARNRILGASGALVLAVGVKVWPVLLLPIVLRPVFREPLRFVAALLVFGLGAAALAAPALLAGFDESDGLLAYARDWERNDAIFTLVRWAMEGAVQAIGLDFIDAGRLARVAVLAVVATVALVIGCRAVTDAAAPARRILVVVAILFLLSPTQYPWYYAWLVPFLAIVPRYALLLLTAMLPLYYFRFYLESLGMTALFDRGVVWLEFLPVLCLALWELVSRPIDEPRREPDLTLSLPRPI